MVGYPFFAVERLLIFFYLVDFVDIATNLICRHLIVVLFTEGVFSRLHPEVAAT